jgi:hypothetical protein
VQAARLGASEVAGQPDRRQHRRGAGGGDQCHRQHDRASARHPRQHRVRRPPSRHGQRQHEERQVPLQLDDGCHAGQAVAGQQAREQAQHRGNRHQQRQRAQVDARGTGAKHPDHADQPDRKHHAHRHQRL